MEDHKELRGLGGWLILISIGVVVAPIRLLLTTVPVYLPIFKDGAWGALTTVGSEAYHPLWGPLLIGEIIYNFGMVAATIYLIYLFFSKNFLFPKIYIIVVAASLIFIPLDSWLVSLILPDNPMFDTETITEYARILISGVIWVPYMLVSKRVKATFVEKTNP